MMDNSSQLLPNTSLTMTDNNNTDDSAYDYYDDYDYSKPLVTVVLSWIFIALFVVVFVVGLGGNCLVCFAVWRNPRMRSVTNIFLVNLAVADLLVVLICLPPTAAEDFFGFWHLGLEMCKIVKYVQKVSVFVSVLTLTAISIERWMAICQPFMFRQTAVRARRIIGVVWLISLSCAVPDLVGMTLYNHHEGQLCQPQWPHDAEELHLLAIFLLFYLLPLVIMTFTYVRVALCLWRSGSMGDSDEAVASVPRGQIQLRKKKAKMLIVVVLLFAVCYLPIYLLFIFMATGVLEYLPHAALPPLAMLAHWLCYFNSSVNPVIYNFMSCNFRREFRVACFICCRRGSERRLTAYEAMRLRNVLRTQYASRPSQNETSGMSRTESTVLATPILNGRRGVEGGGADCKRPSDNGRHLFIHYQAPDSSPVLDSKEQEQLPSPSSTAPARSVSPESTRRTRLSATPNAQMQRDVYTAIVNNMHHMQANKPNINPKMKVLMEML